MNQLDVRVAVTKRRWLLMSSVESLSCILRLSQFVLYNVRYWLGWSCESNSLSNFALFLLRSVERLCICALLILKRSRVGLRRNTCKYFNSFVSLIRFSSMM